MDAHGGAFTHVPWLGGPRWVALLRTCPLGKGVGDVLGVLNTSPQNW
jgi:hypothetical protein